MVAFRKSIIGSGDFGNKETRYLPIEVKDIDQTIDNTVNYKRGALSPGYPIGDYGKGPCVNTSPLRFSGDGVKLIKDFNKDLEASQYDKENIMRLEDKVASLKREIDRLSVKYHDHRKQTSNLIGHLNHKCQYLKKEYSEYRDEANRTVTKRDIEIRDLKLKALLKASSKKH